MSPTRTDRRSASEGARPQPSTTFAKLQHKAFLKTQQRGVHNLSTVVVKDGVTHLATFPYPLTPSGRPVAPEHVDRAIKSSHCPTVNCFCRKPAKFINPIVTGEFTGKRAFACELEYEALTSFSGVGVAYFPKRLRLRSSSTRYGLDFGCGEAQQGNEDSDVEPRRND
ncbi:hypothetical protein R3P38DRAFT_3196524 [Favolaschia claudopus]|uniref:Uncharacterized protein n=1 Tax=Favolaschia claudopus TaxID=2862362 RepID=A0AAW0B787_9AGAR